jgi:hypothetical protein
MLCVALKLSDHPLGKGRWVPSDHHWRRLRTWYSSTVLTHCTHSLHSLITVLIHYTLHCVPLVVDASITVLTVLISVIKGGRKVLVPRKPCSIFFHWFSSCRFVGSGPNQMKHNAIESSESQVSIALCFI